VTANPEARRHAVVAARAAADRKAEDIVALDVSDRLVLTDVFVVASGRNERQVSAIVDAIEEALFREGVKVRRKEGEVHARWVLLDFGDVVVHVQHAEDRLYYALERLWKDCPVVELPADLYRRRGAEEAEKATPAPTAGGAAARQGRA
jgi:ribosome-associated protein